MIRDLLMSRLRDLVREELPRRPLHAPPSSGGVV